MKGSSKQQDELLFHRFVECADKLPIEGSIFPILDFMDQSIRKKFNQLKKTKKPEK